MFRLQKEQEVADLETKRKEAAAARERENESKRWLEEQQKKLLEARVNKQLAMEMPSGTGELVGIPYDPEGGLSVKYVLLICCRVCDFLRLCDWADLQSAQSWDGILLL